MNVEFGCAQCYGDDARTTWERTAQLKRIRPLVDDSHFIVQLIRCEACGQEFLWITTEVVDWRGGDDAQYRRVVPVTAAEAEGFRSADEEPEPASLAAVARGRRYLCSDWPTGQPAPSVTWATGEFAFVPRD